jgi:predicted amidophosphoribosyltransferase
LSGGVGTFSSMLLRDQVWEVLGAYRCADCRRRSGPLCSRCLTKARPPTFRRPPPDVDNVVCGWDYSGPARSLVLGLKLRGERACAGPLVTQLAAQVRREGLTASVLTWVPGRRRDIRRRGFDHARELARRLAGELGIEALPLLGRRLDRPDQAGLSAKDRRSNLLGSFLSRPSPERVALVDDLITTGATATACALALKGAGATRVELLAACSADRI